MVKINCQENPTAYLENEREANMVEILEGQTLEIENLISFRGKITQTEIERVGKDMEMFVAQAGANRVGNPVTATYGIEADKIDMELLLPIDKKIACSEKYAYKERIRIVNAVVAKYIGNPNSLQEACNELNQYIFEQKLVPVTAGYNITKRVDAANLENTEIDVYVGISQNIL